MVEAGLILLVVGMLVVFIFLIIMVILSNFASRIMLKYFPEEPEPLPVRRSITAAASDDTELAIAIAAAHSL